MPTALCSIALALLVALHEGKSQAATTPIPEQPAPLPRARGSHLRTRRCSCSSWLDKECVYFCHLDIIWVNTPGLQDDPAEGEVLSLKRTLGREQEESDAEESCQDAPQPSLRFCTLRSLGLRCLLQKLLACLTPQCWTSVTLPQRTFPDSQSRLSIPAIRLQATFRLNTSHYVFICLI
ncbi:hypothetical protein MJT46_001610 [Ovis ammon polii x Ovis aries]|nr:hypothetical protein MJT46_001610 [Ovis ammon polii x Ovis aries]